MLHVEGETTGNPTVDYTTGKATVLCDGCQTTKTAFPLAQIIKLTGDGLILSSAMFKCTCDSYTTVYSGNGQEPIIPILLRLLGFSQ